MALADIDIAKDRPVYSSVKETTMKGGKHVNEQRV
jgi:hypothetical protein